MRNTKCTCYENYMRLNFRVFDLRKNKVIANISGYTVHVPNYVSSIKPTKRKCQSGSQTDTLLLT